MFDQATHMSRAATQLDASVFDSLFTSCAVEGMGRLALKILSKMRKLGFYPSRENLRCLIDAVAKSEGTDAQMEQMKFLEAIVFGEHWRDKYCFGNDLLAAYVDLSGKFDVVEACLNVLRVMDKNKRANKFVFTKLVSMFVEQGEIAQMARLCTAGIPEFGLERDKRLYVVMMQGFSTLKSGQRKLVFDLYDHMVETHMEIDKYVLTIFLRTAKQMRKFDRAAKIVEMLEHNPYKIAWDLPLLNELMQVASQAANAPALVERIMREMDMRKLPKDVTSYNLRISLNARLKKIDEAFSILQEMGRNDVQPNEGTFTSLLTACRACRDADKAFRVFQSMYDSDMPLDNKVHESILESIFTTEQRGDLDRKWRRMRAEWIEQSGGRSSQEMPTPYKTGRAPFHGGEGRDGDRKQRSSKNYDDRKLRRASAEEKPREREMDESRSSRMSRGAPAERKPTSEANVVQRARPKEAQHESPKPQLAAEIEPKGGAATEQTGPRVVSEPKPKKSRSLGPEEGRSKVRLAKSSSSDAKHPRKRVAVSSEKRQSRIAQTKD